MNKKRFLKSILATSALAAALLPAQGALGTNDTTGNVDIALNVAGGAGAGGLTDAWAAGNVIKLTGGHDISANSADAVFGVDLQANNGKTLTLTKSSTIVGMKANAAETMNITFGAAETLTLNGAGKAAEINENTYTAIGDINFAGNEGTVILSATGTTIQAVNDAAAAIKGTLKITGAGNTVGAIGAGNALKMVEITAGDGTTTLGATVSNQVSITGSTKVAAASITAAGVGLTADVDAMKTGSGLVTLTGASTIGATAGRLNIGSGGITTDNNLTIGKHGSTGAGKLTFTDDATLKISGDYAATGGVHVNNAGGGKTLVIDGDGAARSIASAITSEQQNVHTLNFQNAPNAATPITISEDIGAKDKEFLAVQITGAHDTVKLTEGANIHATTVSLHDAAATLEFGDKSTIYGTLKANAGGDGAVNVASNSAAGSKDMKLDVNQLASITFAANDDNKKSSLTFGVTDANTAHSIADVTMVEGSSLELDLSDMTTAARTYALTLGGLTATKSGDGTIKFNIHDTAKPTSVTLSAGGDLASVNAHLGLIDATGDKLTLSGGNKIHVDAINASELTLDQVELGIYDATHGQNSPSKFNITTNDSEILTDSTLKDGLNIHYKTDNELKLNKNVALNGSLSADTNNHGTLTLAEDNAVKLTSAGDDKKAIKVMTFTAGDKNSLESDATMYINTLEIIGANDPTLSLKGDLKGAIINATANKGTLVLNGGSISGAVANGAALKSVEVAGDVAIGTAGTTFKTAAIKFTSDSTLTLAKGVTSTIGAISTEKNGTGTLAINHNHTTGGDIGQADYALKSIIVGEDSTFTVTNKNALHVNNVLPAKDAKSVIAFAGDSTATETNIGSSDMRFRSVTTGAGNVNLGSVYAAALTNGGTIVAKDLHVTEGITGGTVSVKDGGMISKTIAILGVGGNVTTLGSATINDVAGTLTLTGGEGKTVTLAGTKVGGAVTADSSTLDLTANTTFSENFTGTNSSLNLDKNTLSLPAGKTVALNGATTITFRSGAKIMSDNITAKSADDVITLNVLGVPTSSISLFATSDGSANKVLFNGTDGKATNFKVSGNEFFKEGVAYDAATGVVTLAPETDVTKVATQGQLNNEAARTFMTSLVATVAKGEGADDVLGQYLDQYRTLSDDKKTENVIRVADKSSVMNNTNMSDMSNVMTDRTSGTAVFGSAPQGVAAGDAAERFGLWAKGTFGTATQKLRKETAGYKGKNYAGYLGVDTMLNDKASVGLTVGYGSSELKHKDAKSGDKTDGSTFMFGAYGTYDLPNNFFLQGNAVIAQTEVKTKAKRVTGNTTYTTANGKFDVMGYGLEVRGGYKYRFDNSLLVPTAGLRFNYQGDTTYTETGAGVQNQKVTGKATTGAYAVAGLALSTALDVDGMALLPEAHLNMDYALSNKAPKVDYNFDGSNLKFNYKGAKPSKFGFNFGTSVMTQLDGIEYGVGYDARIADKYLGHQGSVKVRLSF